MSCRSSTRPIRETARAGPRFGPAAARLPPGASAGGKGAATTCTNNLTGIVISESRERFWRVPGLTVVYAPSVTCQALGSQGTLIIKLGSLVEATQKRRKDSEPKM